MAQQKQTHIKTTKTPGGWKLEMDNDTWVQLMSALSLAIRSEEKDGHADQIKTFQLLRTSFSSVVKTEGF